MLYNLTAGLLRAIGNSRVPLYFLLLASCLNIGLDLTFILLCNMGVFGAALTPQYTVPMFIDGDPSQILQYAAVYFNIIPRYFIPLGLIFVFRNVLQGMGYAMTTLVGGFIELGSRIVLSVYAIRNASFAGVCYADVAAWVCTGVFLVICYIVVFARKRRAMVLKEE